MEIVIGMIVVVVIGVASFYLFNLAQETVTRKVKVVGKRTRTSTTPAAGAGQSTTHTSYHCTFEFEDGQREEYAVGEGKFASIAEGDRGELDTKGVLFWDFRRVTG